jgi:ferritin-like metal-binding protein YciE
MSFYQYSKKYIMEKITDLQELLKHELNDLYSAEVQLTQAIPKMVEKASNKELKKAFSDHLAATREHKNRLDEVKNFFSMEKVEETKGFFANLFKSKEGEEHCKAMEGLIKEAQTLMGEDMAPEVMDSALIAAAQKIAHYEISSYGTARAFARQLGFEKVYTVLSSTLAEEYEADDSLTALAVGKLNRKAEIGEKLPGVKPAVKNKATKPVADKPTVKKSVKALKTVAKPTPPKSLAKKIAKPAPKKTTKKVTERTGK